MPGQGMKVIGSGYRVNPPPGSRNVGPWKGMRCELIRNFRYLKCGTKGTVTGLRQLGQVRILFDGETHEIRIPSNHLVYRPAESSE